MKEAAKEIVNDLKIKHHNIYFGKDIEDLTREDLEDCQQIKDTIENLEEIYIL